MENEAKTTPPLVAAKGYKKPQYAPKPIVERPIQRPLPAGISKDETAPLQQDLRAEPTRRRKRDTEEQDPLYIDPKMIPPGLSVEWKRFSCYGKPDPTNIVRLQRQGWEPCPVDKWRFLVGDEYEGTQGGLRDSHRRSKEQNATGIVHTGRPVAKESSPEQCILRGTCSRGRIRPRLGTPPGLLKSYDTPHAAEFP